MKWKREFIAFGNNNMNKIVSILIPSRKRPHGLGNTIRSLIKHAHDPSNIEILLRFDRDDEASIIWWNENKEEFKKYCKAFASDRVPGGYENLHIMYNELAEKSTGDFLFIFNDDLLMTTDGYDNILSSISEKNIILQPSWNHRSWNTFPIISREVYETIGMVSPHVHLDRWIDYLGTEAGIQMKVSIHVDHVGDTDRRNNGHSGEFPDLHYQETGKYVDKHDTIDRAEIQQIARKLTNR